MQQTKAEAKPHAREAKPAESPGPSNPPVSNPCPRPVATPARAAELRVPETAQDAQPTEQQQWEKEFETDLVTSDDPYLLTSGTEGGYDDDDEDEDELVCEADCEA